MRKTLLGLLFLGTTITATSQTTWSDDAAQVIYDNCTVCHHDGGIGPSPLMTYAQASSYGAVIQNYVTNNIMPPWMADTSYSHFAQERVLTQNERDIILDWVADGLLPGDLQQAPPPPVYTANQMLPGAPDLTITAPNYMSKANFVDDYVCFSMNTNLTSGKKVKAIEVIPGNSEIVHHCLVYSSTSGLNQTDTAGNCAGPLFGTLMGGYTPGATPIIFPSSVDFSAGMQLAAGSQVILGMHYPAGSYGEWDQTKVNFYFYDEPVANFREVFCDPIIEDWNFTIPAGQFDTLTVSYGPITSDMTVLSVFPHMHLLGHYIESWAITPSNDTLKFCKIPLWDFDWQDFYWFEYLRYVPVGSTVWGKAVWNNTVTNPHNPNNPPQPVTAGFNTTDEMFQIYHHYMAYQAGDENVNIDSLTTEFLSTVEIGQPYSDMKVYPNPFIDFTEISYQLKEPAFVSIYIYDIQGAVVKKLLRENQQMGPQNIIWNGTNTAGETVGSGIYFYSIMINGQHYSGKVLKQ
jgi:hypothetical protein